MYHKLLSLGRSGSGKSATLVNMDPLTTGVLNIDKKEFPFPHNGEWKTVKLETGWPDLTQSNYVETDKVPSIWSTLKAWEGREEIRTIVMDTLTHLISADYVKNTIGKDFKAYQKMGKNVYEILDWVRDVEKNVVVFGHIEDFFNDMGQRTIKLKTQGKMIDTFEPESYFTTMLFNEVTKGEDGEVDWKFRTRPQEVYEKVKSPGYTDKETGEKVRALEMYEPNDLKLVLEKLDKFYTKN